MRIINITYLSIVSVEKQQKRSPWFLISARPMRFLVREGPILLVIPPPVPSALRERCVLMLTVPESRPVSRGPTLLQG